MDADKLAKAKETKAPETPPRTNMACVTKTKRDIKARQDSLANVVKTKGTMAIPNDDKSEKAKWDIHSVADVRCAEAGGNETINKANTFKIK